MQNDTISRSALVAELEAFKMSMGDIVLRFIVDRVIERVNAQPVVESLAATPEEQQPVEASNRENVQCAGCKYHDLTFLQEPCKSCGFFGDRCCWEPMEP